MIRDTQPVGNLQLPLNMHLFKIQDADSLFCFLLPKGQDQ